MIEEGTPLYSTSPRTAEDVKALIEAAFRNGMISLGTQKFVPFLENIVLLAAEVVDGGRRVEVVMQHTAEPRILLGRRVDLYRYDGSWDETAAEHADAHVQEAVLSNGMGAIAAREPDARGIRFL